MLVYVCVLSSDTLVLGVVKNYFYVHILSWFMYTYAYTF